MATIGIDLGTTNSCVSVFEAGETKVIPNKEGKNTTPSIVAFTDRGEILVGDSAKRQAITNPEKTIYSIKRIMGLMMDEEKAKEAQSKVGYKIVDRNKAAAVEVSGKVYTPQEISAKILSKLKEDAQEYLGKEVTDAVITVPAYFNDAQRKATQEAGTIAGLNVLRIINEPTAAALSYGLDKKGEEKILVYDFGGGTFDVSVLEVGDGTFEVLATDGNAFLGGDDYDNALINYIIEEFKKDTGLDLSNDKMAMQRLKDESEKTKKELSNTTEVEINLPFITVDSSGPKHLVQKISRAKFESITESITEETLQHIKNVLKDSNISKDKIDQVVMVGGSTRIPKVQELVSNYFNKQLNKGVNPDEVVAKGAAVQAGVIVGDVKDVLLLDVTPLSLGIETMGGVMTKIIEKGTTIPVKKSEIFSTAQDNQPAVSVVIGQGEREFIKDNKNLGTFQLGDISPAPRGVPQIEITLDIDANGVLNVTAKDKSTGKENSITITGSSGLSEQEIEKMVQEANEYKVEDEKRKQLVEVKNIADSTIHQVRKELNEQNKTSQEVESLCVEIEKLVQDDSATKENIEQKTQQLIQLSQKVLQEQEVNVKKDKPNDDDVIDAEVE